MVKSKASTITIRDKYTDTELRQLFTLQRLRLVSYTTIGEILGYSRQYAELLTRGMAKGADYDQWLEQEFSKIYDCTVPNRAGHLQIYARKRLSTITEDEFFLDNARRFVSYLITMAEATHDIELVWCDPRSQARGKLVPSRS